MKAIRIPNGILHLSESKAFCPHCERHIPIDEVDEKLQRSDKGLIRHKCKCKRFIGITSDFRGDIVSFELGIKNKATKIS